jgi:uroporphyrin-III C-methyltransferase/precorrin-2 dehydrogenase/sirohydrochlorin ferrochelatase
VNALVSLVGAGPGDPDLLTLKALRRLREADLVLYDALVSAEVIHLASGARRFCVGKRAGRPGVAQETINRLLVRAARRGQRVVRLKCGDPFLLGRGGEEALALAAAGVPFEVVPGVSSALAAPALAGVPVTHRGLASGVLVVSGHAESAWRPAIEALPPLSVTVVVLMGLATRAGLAAALMARGWPRGTPAAVLWAASTPEAEAWYGPLAGLAAAPAGRAASPGTVVVGKVVSLARVLAGGAEAPLDAPARAAARGTARRGGGHEPE